MALTPKQQEIYEKLQKLPFGRFPKSVSKVAKEFGISTQSLRETLSEILKAGLMTPDLERQILIQKALDLKYLNVTDMIAAPLLTADEIRARQFFPGRSPRPIQAVTIPRSFGGNNLSFCSFVIPDNALGPLQMWERQVAVCAIGLLPRQGAPVLCILPVLGTVCLRCCYQINDEQYELADPERKQVMRFHRFEYPDYVIGPIVAIQRYCNTCRMPDEPMLKKEKE